jgi:hypothetical protein
MGTSFFAGGQSMVGYSGTPLFKKLGVKDNFKVCALDAPAGYRALLAPLPAGVTITAVPSAATNIAHVFVTERIRLARTLATLRKKLAPQASIWVSRPKKSSRVATDITEDTIRAIALPLGLVDIKVCAVTEVWSGLKLVVRKELRPKADSAS